MQHDLTPAEAELARVRQDLQVIKADIGRALARVDAARAARLHQLARSRAP